MPRAVHAPPIPAPSRPNLLSSVAADPQTIEVGRWEFGIEYEAPNYNSGSSAEPCGEDTKTVTDPPDNIQWDPYWIWTERTCSTFGDIERVRSLARQDLEAQSSHKIEEILASNLVDATDFGASHPNVGFSDASLPEKVTTPTQAEIDSGIIYTPNGWVSYPIVTAFRDMIEALGDQLGGARGMIHVEARIVPLIAYTGMAVQNGQRLVTTLGDHIVVPGTGYTGNDPDGGASSENYSWIYGTSMVEVLLGPILTPGQNPEVINRSTNQIQIRAERIALAHWDRQAHIGIPVCLEDPFGDCSDAGS